MTHNPFITELNPPAMKIYLSLCLFFVASISPLPASGWSLSPQLIQLGEIYQAPTPTPTLSPLSVSSGSDAL